MEDKADQQVAALSVILDRAIRDDPVLHKGRLKTSPNEPMIHAALVSLLSRSEAKTSHVAEILRQYLPDFPPTGTILFLGSGNGIELLHARKVFPHARLLAADSVLLPETVMTEYVARADFRQFDLSAISPPEVIERFGFNPDAVVCRHPQVLKKDAWWSTKLAEWGKQMQSSRGKLLVTNYFQEEQTPILAAMERAGLNPTTSKFSGGNTVGSATSDGFITLVE